MRLSFRKISLFLAFICLICAMMLSSCGDKDKNTDNEKVSHIKIDSFTVGYLTESAYKEGTFEESAISPTIDMTDGRNAYMVVDFSYTLLEDIGSGKSIMLKTTFPGRGVLDITIEEAATSGVEEIESTEETTLSAKFSIQEDVGESKSTRVILRLMPVSGGTVNFWLRLAVDNETNISGISLIGQSLSTGVSTFGYKINPDGKSYSVSWASKDITEAIIPDTLGDSLPVTAINDEAFKNCTKLTSITIPDSVTSIGNWAFYGCTGLTGITIPDSITSIGSSVFAGCTSLAQITVGENNTQYKNIDGNHIYTKDGKTLIGYAAGSGAETFIIPQGVTSIESYAFYGCQRLVNLTIPDSVTSIGNDAFENCTSLTSVTIPDSVTSIGSYAFSGCTSLTCITIPDSITNIGDSVFSGCTSLTSVTTPDSVTSIGEYAFSNCTSLTSITIPDSVTSIGDSAFKDCPIKMATIPTSLISYIQKNNLTTVIIDGGNNIPASAFRGCTSLTSVTIGNSVTSIGGYAFYGCTSLTSVHITDIAKWCNISFDNSDANPLYYAHNLYLNGELVTELIIPDSVTSIGSSAFYGCTSLMNITIGNSVTRIENYAFQNCYRLIEVINHSALNIIAGSEDNGYIGKYAKEVHTGESKIVDINGYLFYTYGGTNYLLGYKGNDNEISLPESYNGENYHIYEYAFYYMDDIKSVTIPDSVTSIGESAFQGCTSLTSITIPDSVTSIGNWAFYGCTSLTSITVGNSVTSIGYSAFRGCTSLTSVTIGNSVTSIGNLAFYDCDSLTSITIPDSVTSIGNYAFQGCTSLTSITIPEGVTSIGRDAFQDCPIKMATIPTSLISYIPKNNLTTVIIDGGNNIPGYAFRDCRSLTSVTIGNSVTSIGNYAFQACISLTSVHITDIAKWCNISFDDLYANPLHYAHNLYLNGQLVTELVIPDSVTSIEDGAFRGCTSLTSITIPDSVKSIGNSAFPGCTSLRSVTIGNSVTSIGNSAFYGCTSLMNITIGNSVTRIENYAFHNCYRLIEVINHSILAITAGSSNNGSVGSYAIEVHTGESKIVNKSGYLFYTYDGVNYLVGYVESDKDILLPENYNGENYQIYEYAFYYMDDIKSVTIPDSVTSIGESAFQGCTSLRSVTIPDSVTSIKSFAFYDCTSLRSVTIGNSVTSIGMKAFENCTSLTRINYRGTKEQWNAISKGTDWNKATGYNTTISYEYTGE